MSAGHKPAGYEPEGYEDVWLTVADGLRVHARYYSATRQEAKLPVVCIPGLTRNCRDFEDLAPWLARERPVLAVDLRGRGLSDVDPDWRRYTLDTYIDDLVQMLDTSQLQRVIVIGTSLGGLVGMSLAARHPARVAALVLNDIGPELDPVGMLRIASSVGTAGPVGSWEAAADEARRTHAFALPDLSAEEWQRFAHRVYRERSPNVIERDMDPAIGRALREQAGPMPDFWSVFRALDRLPMLALRGEYSDLFAEATLARMHEIHPALESCTIPRRGHSPTLDEAESRLAIEHFLAKENL